MNSAVATWITFLNTLAIVSVAPDTFALRTAPAGLARFCATDRPSRFSDQQLENQLCVRLSCGIPPHTPLWM